MTKSLLAAALATAALTTPALAERAPPAGSLPLSQIIATLEQQADFAYVEEIDLDDGLYEVEYRSKDGREIKVKIDPVTGNPR